MRDWKSWTSAFFGTAALVVFHGHHIIGLELLVLALVFADLCGETRAAAASARSREANVVGKQDAGLGPAKGPDSGQLL